METTTYNHKTSALMADDFEFSTATTGLLALGASAAVGSIEVADDKDAFKVELVAGTDYVFDLIRTSTGGLSDPYLFIYNSAFNLITLDDDGGVDGNAQLVFTPSTSGTYYLGAMDFQGGVGNYTLSIARANKVPTGDVTISGTLAAGQVLTASSTVADADGMGALAFQWQTSSDGSAWTNIAGATAATYTASAAAASTQVRATVSYTDQAGNAEQVSSVGLGGSGNDTIQGTMRADTMFGGAGNDMLRGGAGNDTIDGGAGIDTAMYGGFRGQYSVQKTSNGLTITHNGAAFDGVDALTGVERLRFADSGFALDTGADGLAGQSYRLYQAAFARTPDSAGVGFWMNALDSGLALSVIAGGFVNSDEYKALYASTLTNRELVTKYYTNILGRAPEQAGLDYWTNALDSKVATIPEVLAFISESAENISITAAVIGNGFPYTPYG